MQALSKGMEDKMMKKIIFATGNEHKMVEIRMILEDLGAQILSLREAGIEADVVEDGTTFEENALIKATEVAKAAGKAPGYEEAVILADDSGLEIDYLNKEPGIYSARYMGEDTSYDIKNQTLIDRLAGVPDEERTARFVCAIAAVFPDGSSEVVRGTMEGGEDAADDGEREVCDNAPATAAGSNDTGEQNEEETDRSGGPDA